MVPVRLFPPLPSSQPATATQLNLGEARPLPLRGGRETSLRRRAEQAPDASGTFTLSARRLRFDSSPPMLAPEARTGALFIRPVTVQPRALPVVRWEQDRFDDEPIDLAHGQSIRLMDGHQMLLRQARIARADEGLVIVRAGEAADGVFSRGFHVSVAAVFHNAQGIGIAHLTLDTQALPRAILSAHAEFFAATRAPAHVMLGYFPDSYRLALMQDAAGQSPQQLRSYFAGAFDPSPISPTMDEAAYRTRVVDLVIERDVRDITYAAQRALVLGGPEFRLNFVPMAGTMVAARTDGSLYGPG